MPGEEEFKANEFLDALLHLARAAGGDPPIPARPDTSKIEDLKRLTGTEQLGAILQAKAEFEQWIEDWTALKAQAEKRLPAWKLLESLLAHAETLPVAAEVKPEIEAIRSGRSLLAPIDHVSPIRAKVAAGLRAAVTELFSALQKAFEEGIQTLQDDASWQSLDESARDQILGQVGLKPPTEPAIKTDESLLAELDRQSLAARADAVAAVPERVTRALAEAAHRLKPEARRVTVRRAMLETEDEVRGWLAEHERMLLEEIKRGPVVIG